MLQLKFSDLAGHPFVYDLNDAYHFFLHLSFTYWWGFQKGWAFNHPVWSVSVEILLYLVFFLTAFRSKSGPVLCLVISAFGFFVYVTQSDRLYLGFAMFFWGGFLYYLTRTLTEDWDRVVPLVYLVSVAGWFLVFVNYYFFDVGAQLLKYGFPGVILVRGFPGYILLSSTLCSLALMEIRTGPWLRHVSWIGDITYSTYLLHFPLNLMCAIGILFGWLDSKFYLHPTYLFCYFILLISVSYLTYISFERPVQNWIRKRMISG